MQTLFIISVLCFLVLIWAGIAIARRIAANKSWNSPPAAMHILPASEPDSSSPGQGRRKAPKAAHHGASKRLDWEYFNKDAGDLSDPYQPRRLRANSGVYATSPKRY